MILHESVRILITRLSAVGDCILTLPVLTALRRHLPTAYIAWAAEPGPAKLLEDHTCLDAVIQVPKGWLVQPRVAWALRRRLRACRFDVAIDPQSLTKSSALAWLSGAKCRIGFEAPQARELARWMNNVRLPAHRPHVVDRQLDLLAALGIEDRQVEFGLPAYPAAAERAEWMLRELAPGGRFAIINPGAGWESRVWPAERFGEVAAYLANRYELPSVVVWAGSGERAWGEQIVEHSSGGAVLAPPTSLPELASLLRRSCLYVGSDTGPTHLAAAMGVRCVTLFGTTLPEVSGPYGQQHVCLVTSGPCADKRHRRHASNEAMRKIEVPAVCQACDLVLAQQREAA